LPRIKCWHLLLLIALTGCFDDQKQRLAKCQLEAVQYPPRSVQAVDHIRLCMQLNGYDWETPAAVKSGKCVGPPRDLSDLSHYTKDELRNPYCYEPSGWLARLLYRLEIRTNTEVR
jgi:hypothetical protein